jgi:hypothetical protein
LWLHVEREIITDFGSVDILLTMSEEGCDLSSLQKHTWQIAVALSQGHPSVFLQQALSRKNTLGGMGFLTEHSCCGLHRNSKIELIMQQETVGGGQICLGVAVIADKTIETGTRIAVSYTGGTTMEEEGWDRIFKCKCCVCASSQVSGSEVGCATLKRRRGK